MSYGKQIVYDLDMLAMHPQTLRNKLAHLESVRPGREIDSGNIHHGLVLTLGVVPEELNCRDDRLRSDIERQLVLVDRELLDVFRKASGEVLPILMKRGG